MTHHNEELRRLFFFDLQSFRRSSTTNDGRDVDRTKNEEEETPLRLQICADVGELIELIVSAIGFRYADARRQVLLWGAERCEGALMATIAVIEDGQVRKPRGWFVATLKRGLEWTPEEIRLDLDARRERELRAMEESNDVTMRRLAQEERAKSAARGAHAFTGSEADASETTRSAGRSSNGSSGG
jgi:hypothetical protein